MLGINGLGYRSTLQMPLPGTRLSTMNFLRESLSLKWVGLFLLLGTGIGLLNYASSGFDGAQENFRRMGIDAYVLVQGYNHGLPVVTRTANTVTRGPLLLAMPLPAGAYLRSGDRVIKAAGASHMRIVRDSNHVRITTEWAFVDPPGSPLVKRTRTKH